MNTHQTIKIVESKVFSDDAEAFLSNTELMALHNLLANNPEKGIALQNYQGLYFLEWNDAVAITYIRSNDEYEIMLISIQSTSDEKIDNNSRKKSFLTLGKIRDFFIGFSIKEIWDLIKETIF
ncbi:MAG: hypothetical protein H7839_12300 [Magnetococcus sp. YQC-5]